MYIFANGLAKGKRDDFMQVMVMKFGGSSVADDKKLNLVAQRIIEFKKKNLNIVVVVSAQGKTTNDLVEQSKSLSDIPNEREMDALLSVGEQITASKLSMLLSQMGYGAISLTGWQAGIKTNSIHEQAKIESIDTTRINKELEREKIVVITGFQGIDDNCDITTLGRGGSDTTAVSVAAALGAEECYIFSDVDGIYSADPHVVKTAKKIDEISYEEMQEISDAGAKVLHDRCIQIGEKFNCNIIALSTFEKNGGTRVGTKIETTEVKSIVNNTKLSLIQIENDDIISNDETMSIYESLLKQNILIESFKHRANIEFYAPQGDECKIAKIIKERNHRYKINCEKIIKISIVGYGIMQDGNVLQCIMDVIRNRAEIMDINVSKCKVELILKNIDEHIVDDLHDKLINKGGNAYERA